MIVAYQTWCSAKGVTPKSATWLGRQLSAQFERGKTAAGRRCYEGVTIAAGQVGQVEGDSGKFSPYPTHVEKSLENAYNLSNLSKSEVAGEY
jgi:hypothetical protein